MKYTTYILVFFLFAASFAQEKDLGKANEFFSALSFSQAIKKYENMVAEGQGNIHVFRQLGMAHYYNARYTDAEKWYSILYEKWPDSITAIEYLRYAQSLQANGSQNKAKKMYGHYVKGIGQEHILDFIDTGDDHYTISIMPGNSDKSEYGASYHEGKLYFASARGRENSFIVDAWTNDPFFDLYQVALDPESGPFGEAMRLKGHVNTAFHESSPAITPDGKHLYFTATHRVNTGKDGIVHLGIFRATHKNGKWKKVRNLSINGKEFNNAHPSLTNDGKTLYFVSDREGGIGQTDLYKVAINENGSLGEPVNLGPEINTPGRESFPYSDGEKGLYFSSDGYLGLGGYDIYFKDLTQPQNAVISLGKPINSNKDDYAFHLISENGVGFFSSNRGDNDDIYQLTQLNPINKLSELVLYGTITGEPQEQAVAKALVRIVNEFGRTIAEAKSDSAGEFMFKTPKQAGSTLRIKKDGYKTYSQVLDLTGSSQELMVHLQESEEAKAYRLRNQEKSLLLAALSPLNEDPISFPFEKTALSDYEKTRLDVLAEVMKEQSTHTLVIVGHTDTRGSKHYNMKLSENRALAAKTYLVSKGVDPTYLKIQGRGEEEPINDCIHCNQEEHQKNRRLQFRLQE
ncbi:OmpA family protein [Sediminicola luteus]|uniref:OmpA-like domain-containing protein n=1 Tax=Sediminicola luteus TaxID=319238 RepID=A0A2A4G9D0_9FLAO|nr:OmpA family protein [Sediminicola luteus]PCE64588.1 hypothetical protein B7P33_09930 [Sediminicola luteus]